MEIFSLLEPIQLEPTATVHTKEPQPDANINGAPARNCRLDLNHGFCHLLRNQETARVKPEIRLHSSTHLPAFPAVPACWDHAKLSEAPKAEVWC